MAKQAPKSGTSRIRFVMFDAEVPEGEIGQLTQAMQKALLGTTTVVQRITPPAALRPPAEMNGGSDHETDESVDDGQVDDVEEAVQAPRPKVERKQAATPEVLPIDFNAFTPSLNAFVAEHREPDSHQQRYLMAAAWYHEHGGVTKVTPAHIYTAYRWLKWPLTLKDFAQTLRDLKSDKLFGSTERGTYTINHLGLQRVADMKNAAGA
jgi:uncharacterized protein YjhX (UPF0386 family)